MNIESISQLRILVTPLRLRATTLPFFTGNGLSALIATQLPRKNTSILDVNRFNPAMRSSAVKLPSLSTRPSSANARDSIGGRLSCETLVNNSAMKSRNIYLRIHPKSDRNRSSRLRVACKTGCGGRRCWGRRRWWSGGLRKRRDGWRWAPSWLSTENCTTSTRDRSRKLLCGCGYRFTPQRCEGRVRIESGNNARSWHGRRCDLRAIRAAYSGSGLWHARCGSKLGLAWFQYRKSLMRAQDDFANRRSKICNFVTSFTLTKFD